MIIQEIVWPVLEVCSEQDMYVRTNKKARLADAQGILFQKQGKASFDTYFNGCSISKWRKYTKVEEVSLQLELKGSFKITLYQKEKLKEKVLKKILLCQTVTLERKSSIELPFTSGEKGMLCFKLEALEDGSVFYGGAYQTDLSEDEKQDVKLGIVICTFMREKFIENNLKLLRKHILENEESPIQDRLEVFVSDNGKTLDIGKLQTEKIHIYPNKNAGGAGGFTRGLMEILEANKNACGVTHALLMDDDIVIDVESIKRTYRILTLLKDKYKDAFIGGAMLRLDQQNIQVESGASWNAGRLDSLKSGLDLNECEACLYNEVEEYREFNAWWYCCFPMDVVREDNLPLPLFIRGDDIEYGLRNMKTLILMNGICVWHEPFENKYSSFLEYYIIRNQLIDNAFHFPGYGVKEAKKDIRKKIIREIALYRYKNVDLILRGVMDFLRGPAFLLKTDPEKLHKDIMESGYKAVPVEECSIPFRYPEYETSLWKDDKTPRKVLRALSLNGNLIPDDRVSGTAVVSMTDVRLFNVYNKKKVLYYDTSTHKGFEVERSQEKAKRCLRKMRKLFSVMDDRFEIIANVFRDKGKELKKCSFWNEYLDLKGERNGQGN